MVALAEWIAKNPDALRNAIRRKRLIRFVSDSVPGYQAGWVHHLICARLEKFLEDVIAKRSPRLMIFMPPGHGKSFIASERFPAWAIGRHPTLKFICSSYAAGLSEDFSHAALALAEDDYYQGVFPGHAWGRKKTRSEWLTAENGGYRAAGVGGTITGKRAHVFVIDDPFKDWKEALSDLRREDAKNWYQSVAMTRLFPGGGIVIIQTRWHSDDISGWLLERAKKSAGSDQWEVLSFPGIAKADEVYGGILMRKAGEALHQDRYPLEMLKHFRANMSRKIWVSLYDQAPADEEGEEFKRVDFRYYEAPPTVTRVAISVDAAFKDAENSDPVSITVWGDAHPDYYLLDNVTRRMGFGETLAAIEAKLSEYPGAAILVEEEANGSAICETLEGKYPGVIRVHPIGGKVARARAMAHVVEGHNLFVPKWAEWCDAYITEMCSFPFGANDDQVDSTSQCINWFLTKEESVGVAVHPQVQRAYGRR